MDVEDLRAFEKVAALRSFSAAARALGAPKSTVSRAVARIEGAFDLRLFQRTTRDVTLTEAGAALQARFADMLNSLDQAVELAGAFASTPGGVLKLSSGIGFGANVMAELLPAFSREYPHIHIALDLSSRPVDLVAEGIDAAIRMGPMQDSGMIATRLGAISARLCAAPAYLERRGRPATIDALTTHDLLEMPRTDRRERRWALNGPNSARVEIAFSPRISVNDPHTIHCMILNGAGIGCVAHYLCAPEITAGELIDLFPDWRPPPVEVSIVFPSQVALTPAARAFIDFMKVAFADSRFAD